MQAIADAGGVANLAGGGIAKLAGVAFRPTTIIWTQFTRVARSLMKRVRKNIGV
jgi:hypothetical protein